MTGITLWSNTSGTIWMDGLSFSNSLTVEQNVLGPGVIAHILRSRMKVMGTIDPGTFDETDLYFHYDQVGNVMMASNSAGTLQTAHHQDAWGNVMSDWQTGLWASASGQAGWHHNTKATDGDLGLVYMYQRWYNFQKVPWEWKFNRKSKSHIFWNKAQAISQAPLHFQPLEVHKELARRASVVYGTSNYRFYIEYEVQEGPELFY